MLLALYNITNRPSYLLHIASYKESEMENNTVGILVSTAVELSFGRRSLKPAGKCVGEFVNIFFRVSTLSLFN